MSLDASPTNPFPGLRPFDAHENHLFFGRDGQSDDLLRRLRRQRFIAVVGTSGSGKSSLVRAGLLPALHGGFMLGAGSNWRVAVLRPGNNPIGHLAQALRQDDVLGNKDDDEEIQLSITEASLRRSALGLIEVVRQARVPAHDNLLIVVDQFEELFRVKVASGAARSDDAAAFVKLLLEATRQTELPIYALITMRSDFLGDCSQFRDLPEMINDGQYLIPRMTRDQRREAITGPVAVGGAEITPRLVNRLLNEVGDNPDQLPLLQHALMRMWQQWEKEGDDKSPLDLPHYESIGGLSEAISRHADEAYDELGSERSRRIAEILFKLLTERGSDNREIRRPTRLAEVCAVAGAEKEEVRAIIEGFRREGRSFLMPPPGVALRDNTFIDISHESLIRGWQRLQRWVDDEALSARIYRRLAETAILYRAGEAGLWRDPDLPIALAWREKHQPNAAWGARYSPDFPDAMNFLDESQHARDAEQTERERVRRKTLRLTQALAAVLLLGLCLSLTLASYAYVQKREATKLKSQAEDIARREQMNARRAEENAERARLAEAEAHTEKARALEAEEKAKESAALAQRKEQEARASLEVAEVAKRAAQMSEALARVKAKEAEFQKSEAEKNARQAEKSASEARNSERRAYNFDRRFRRSIIEGNSTRFVLARQLEQISPPLERAHWRAQQADAIALLGNHDRAIELFTSALDEDSENLSALNGRGAQYLINKQPEKALADFDQALRINTKIPGLYINKANSLGYLGDYGNAIETLRKGIEAFNHYGYTEYREQDIAEDLAAATGQKFIYADSDDTLTTLYFGLANLAASSGRKDFAALLDAADNRPPSPNAYLYALNWSLLNYKERPNDYGALVAQGALWQRAAYCQEAKKKFDQFRDEHARRGDPRYNELATWLAIRQPEKSLNTGTNCITASPSVEKNARDHMLDGVEYSLSNQPEAEGALSTAINLDKQNPDFWIERMKFRYLQGNYVGAKEDAEEIIKIAPDTALAYLYRALAKVQLNPSDETIVSDTRKAKELNPTTVPAVTEDVIYGKALVEKIAATNSDEAIDFLMRSAKYNKPAAYPHYLMAKLLNDKGDFSQALERIETAIALNNGQLEFYDEKLRAEEGVRRGTSGAEKAKEVSIEGQRTKAREFSDAGKELLRIGKTGEALFAFGESLRMLNELVRQKNSEDVSCDVATNVEKIFQLVSRQGTKDDAIAYLKTHFSELTTIASLIQSELKQLSDAP
ncbi:MAG TPA: AAA family ATPase [Pyrinomonadaceae bacterium]|nr:AAA family ATPase [Pyrinomonadaceae bacterium]